MSATGQAAQRVTAMQIAATLRSYERHIGQLASGPLDMDVYQAASLEIDQLRAWCGTLPQVSVPWIGLLIAHADLVYLLWRDVGKDASAAPEMRDRLRVHRAATRALLLRCQRLANAPDKVALPAWR